MSPNLLKSISVNNRIYSSDSGGVIIALSILSSCFVTRIEFLYLTLGIGAGFGISLILLVNYTIIPHYFDKRLGLATALTQTGPILGLFLFAALNNFLLTTYGFEGSLLILAAVSLHLIPIGMLMLMPAKRIDVSKDGNNSEKQQLLAAKDNDRESTKYRGGDLAMEEMCDLVENEDEKTLTTDHDSKDLCTDMEIHVDRKTEGTANMSKEVTNPKDGSNIKSSWPKLQSFVEYFGLDLFGNKAYTLTAITSGFVTLPQQMTTTVLPEHIIWTGGTTQEATNTLLFIGVSSILFRLFLGRLSSENQRTRLNLLIISSILSGTSLVCCLLYSSYWMYVIFSVLWGITKGILVVYFALFMVYVVGKERSHHGFGIAYTIKGIVLLIGMPGFGAVADSTFDKWGYSLVFICLGVCEIIAGLIFLAIRLLFMNKE